jgi:signal transduction histidine kinase
MPERDLRSLRRSPRAPLALVSAGFSVLVLALCVLGGAHFKAQVEREAYRQTGNLAQVLMTGFDDDAALADAMLTRLATEIAPGDMAPAHQPELHRLLAGYVLQPSMLGAAVLDRDGVLVASGTAATIAKTSLADRNVFRIHADTPGQSRLYISAPVRVRDEWALQFSRPLRDASGALYGVVLLSCRLSHFIRLYEKLKLSDRGLAGLTGKDGIVRVRTLNGEIGYGEAVQRIPLVYNRVLAGETGGIFDSRGGPDAAARIGTFVASQTTPFYVTVAYDTDSLRGQYLGYFVVLGLCWAVLTAAMAAAAAFIQRLGQLGRQAELAVINSTVAERQKISADMHDSIGASLAALLAHFTTETVDLAAVRRRLGEILMELRFLVDSAETDAGDVNLLLSNVRHRMGRGIELAGIRLDWQVGELPEIRGLTARDALAIKLVLMEALSNVLHHSKAATATVAAGYDRQAARISIAVTDDGCGFEPIDAAGGRGLLNMHRRIATISTGATMSVDASPGRGTTVRIALTAPA